MKILVTGSTGYIGGRLVPLLLARGHDVRCLVRDPTKLALHPWRDRVEVTRADLLRPETLDQAFEGSEAAYYLVHSLGQTPHFEKAEAESARNFQQAAERHSLGRIVYLGGLGSQRGLSRHLASRHQVGRLLAAGSVPVTELRAAVIIGSGSLSFEMLRHLTDVLPVMTTPTWVRTRCQPIGIDDVLQYLVAALSAQSTGSEVVEIGGPDILTYQQMMTIYAEIAGLRRRIIIPVPVLTPKLSSLWIGLVTPLPAAAARPLVDSLRNEVIVTDPEPSRRFGIRPVSYREALRRALADQAESRWTDAGASGRQPGDPEWAGARRFEDERVAYSETRPEDLAWAFMRVGGSNRYYAADWAWGLRGLVDRLIGGPGLRRGRRHPEELRPGEALDFWRVVDVEPGRRLKLRAEMRLPGEAFLQWQAAPSSGGSELTQTAVFYPRGLLGRLYWWLLFPFHVLIFGRMARAITSTAARRPPS